jgi:hypothetical protein
MSTSFLLGLCDFMYQVSDVTIINRVIEITPEAFSHAGTDDSYGDFQRHTEGRDRGLRQYIDSVRKHVAYANRPLASKPTGHPPREGVGPIDDRHQAPGSVR